MDIYRYDLERVQKICVHEAGHFVAARKLKFKTCGISITVHQPPDHSGESCIEMPTPILDMSELQEYVRKRIQIVYAGVIAEASFNGNYDATYAEQQWEKLGGMIDHAKARELIHILRNCQFPQTFDGVSVNAQLKQIDDELINESGALVLSNLKLIKEIGAKLASKCKEYSIRYKLTETEINSAFPELNGMVGSNGDKNVQELQ